MGHQSKDEPALEREEQTSPGLRRILARLDAQDEEFREIKQLVARADLVTARTLAERLEAYVSFKAFGVMIGTAAVVIVGAAWAVTARERDKAEVAGQAAVQDAVLVVSALKKEVDTNKDDATRLIRAVQVDVNEGRNDTRDLYRYMATGQRSRKLETPATPTVAGDP